MLRGLCNAPNWPLAGTCEGRLRLTGLGGSESAERDVQQGGWQQVHTAAGGAVGGELGSHGRGQQAPMMKQRQPKKQCRKSSRAQQQRVRARGERDGARREDEEGWLALCGTGYAATQACPPSSSIPAGLCSVKASPSTIQSLPIRC